jgi:DNA-binding CsgD family transcriptional regulator
MELLLSWVRRPLPFVVVSAMPSSRTPEGSPLHCSMCGRAIVMEVSSEHGDTTCPFCGCLIKSEVHASPALHQALSVPSERLEQAYDRLGSVCSPRTKQVVELTKQGCTPSQIAHQLGCYERAVRRELERVRAMLDEMGYHSG